MPNILLIETSTSTLSVAIIRGEQVVSHREREASREHASLLLTFVDEALLEAKLTPSQLEAVAISKGPGSYTGLRIGVSSAKGLCYAIEKPLISVSPLQAMALEAAQQFKSDYNPDTTLFCAMTDAGRMEVYAGIYNAQGREVREVEAEIVETTTYASYLQKANQTLYFIGNGAEKCRSILEVYEGARIIPHIGPSAIYMAPLALEAFQRNLFENIAYYTPFYLKDFVAGHPHVKGLKHEHL